jgi:GNAT superfamily N-acetyltransferase
MNLQIHALNSSRLDDYLDFFDNRAFCDNPDWAGCYCVFNHFSASDEEWMQRSAEANRADAIRMIQSGTLHGYLAYDGGSAVGWANVNDKSAFARFAKLETPCDEGSRVCAVTCFVINPDYRRMGIARTLLEHACDDYAAKGSDILEAYPVLAENTCAAHYHGHPAMFIAAGFHLCKEYAGFGCMQKYLKETS